MADVTIMMGIPGSGKSTWADTHRPNSEYCSADSYFMTRSGKYAFDPSKLKGAHGACLLKFIRCADENALVVVDNTNTTAVEIAPYIAIANAYNRKVEIVAIMADVEIAAARNTHGVPVEKVREMNERLHQTLVHWPVYWPKPREIRV